MVINHLLTGMILQGGPPRSPSPIGRIGKSLLHAMQKTCQEVFGWLDFQGGDDFLIGGFNSIEKY